MTRVAKIIMYDRYGHILVLRRSSTHPYYAFHLDLPGGIVEVHETALEGVVREVVEEAGLILEGDNLQLVAEQRIKTQTLYTLYVVHLEEETPPVQISWEHDQYEWLRVEEVLRRPVPDRPDPVYVMACDYLREHHL